MAEKIPVDTLYYATIVTKDAKALAREHSRFYDIPDWKVVHHTPARLSNTRFRGRSRGAPPAMGFEGRNPAPGEFAFTTATGTSRNGGVTFQIVQPTDGLSTFEAFLVTRGTGIHSVFMSVMQPADFARMTAWLRQQGIGIAQSFTIDDAADFHYLDTREALGGFYVQIVVPRVADWESAINTDETWDFDAEIDRPDAAKLPALTTGIPHFGVIVHDVEKHTENFARLFGQSLWRGMHWRTEAGSLEDTTCNGEKVTHAYFTGRGDIGKTPLGVPFGFEIVQPTFGPSHYKEQFLQVLGPGIHHVDLNFPVETWQEWEALNAWLARDFDAPTCMSGWLRNKAALFQYQDTYNRLGYVTEIHAPRPPGKPMRWAPDYWYDFSAQLDQQT
jgi:hypothetical protein